MESNNIFVYIEVHDKTVADVSYQLLSLAQDLKSEYKAISVQQEVVAILCGHQVDSLISSCYEYGADRVIAIDDEKLRYPSTQHLSHALVECVRKYHPEVFLIGATIVGRDVAPRVAATIRTGLTADAIKVEVDASRSLLMTRPAFGGNLYATIICPHTYPQMSSIRPDVFVKKQYHNEVRPTETLDISFIENDEIEVLTRVAKPEKKANLSKANVIVAGGRSMANHLELLKETANLLEGSLGASRGLIETGMVGKDFQIGQTGVTVRPSIYLACGISGAVQHTAGMDQSQTIVAINTDPNASIFGLATLGIVADAPSVLKLLPKYL